MPTLYEMFTFSAGKYSIAAYALVASAGGIGWLLAVLGRHAAEMAADKNGNVKVWNERQTLTKYIQGIEVVSKANLQREANLSRRLSLCVFGLGCLGVVISGIQSIFGT